MEERSCYRGAYARRNEVTQDKIRERRGDSWEHSTGRKMRVAIGDFWQNRNLPSDHIPSGTWKFHEEDVRKRWTSRKQEQPESAHITLPKAESFLDRVRREVREKREAEEAQRQAKAEEQFWKEEWEKDMREIERERKRLAKQAARAKRARRKRKDAAGGNVAAGAGMSEGIPLGFGVPQHFEAHRAASAGGAE